MSTGFKDPEEQYPTQPYQDNQTTNKAAREEWEAYARLAADAPPGVDLGIKTDWQPKYPYNKVEETSSGHRIEVDDTPGGERLSYVHKDGSAIEMYPDAKDATTFLLNSVGKMVKLVGDDFTMIVNGNGDIHYNGNLNLNVTGDFNINCNNFTVTTQGKQVEEIKQEKIENFVGDRVVTTQGNKSEVVLGAYTVESMSGDTHIVSKGGVKISAEEDVEILAGTEVRVSAEERITTSAPENFMLGKCVTVAGANGTIGGENMQMYTKNLRANGSVYADETVKTKQVNFERADGDVVHAHLVGDVTGKADAANQSDFATTAGQAPTGTAGSPGTNEAAPSNTLQEDNTAETTEPTSAIMTEALNKTKTLGVRKVTVDDGKISNSVKGSDGSSGEATTDNTANRPDTFGDGEPTVVEGDYQQALADQRAQFAAELEADPALKERVQALANAELGSNPGAIMETMMNRAAAEGKTLSEIVNNTAYYAPYKNGAFDRSLSALRGSTSLQTSTSQALQNALNGSNITNLATHAASGSFGIESYSSGTLTQTLTERGSSEYFYRKDKPYTGVGINHGSGKIDKAWYDNIIGGL